MTAKCERIIHVTGPSPSAQHVRTQRDEQIRAMMALRRFLRIHKTRTRGQSAPIQDLSEARGLPSK